MPRTSTSSVVWPRMPPTTLWRGAVTARRSTRHSQYWGSPWTIQHKCHYVSAQNSYSSRSKWGHWTIKACYGGWASLRRHYPTRTLKCPRQSPIMLSQMDVLPQQPYWPSRTYSWNNIQIIRDSLCSASLARMCRRWPSLKQQPMGPRRRTGPGKEKLPQGSFYECAQPMSDDVTM